MSYTRIIARGHGAFPVDMLRFLQAWPATSQDAVRIVTSIGFDAVNMETMVQRDIVLECEREGAGLAHILDRFRSFGWSATAQDQDAPANPHPHPHIEDLPRGECSAQRLDRGR